MLWIKTLSKIKRQLLYLSNTRELNGVPVTKCLPYINLVYGSYYTNLAYPKRVYVVYAIDIWYNIITSRSFYVILYTTWLCDCDWCVTICDILLALSPSIKEIKIKIIKVHCLQFWYLGCLLSLCEYLTNMVYKE